MTDTDPECVPVKNGSLGQKEKEGTDLNKQTLGNKEHQQKRHHWQPRMQYCYSMFVVQGGGFQ